MGDTRQRKIGYQPPNGGQPRTLADGGGPRRKHADPTLPVPGETLCPICDQGGRAVLDDRGVRIFHPRQRANPIIGCRWPGPFHDLLSVADDDLQIAFRDAPALAVCPRCRHTRDAHNEPGPDDGRVNASNATPCACGCPGPGAVVPRTPDPDHPDEETA